MRKLVFLCPYLPYPPENGARIDMWSQLQYFQRRGYSVHIVVLHTPMVKKDFQQDYIIAESLDMDVSFIDIQERWNTSDTLIVEDLLQGLFDKLEPNIIWSAYADFAPFIAKVNTRNSLIVFRSINFELAHHLEKMAGLEKLWEGGLRLRFYRWREFIKRHWRVLWRIYNAERIMHHIADHLLYIGWRDMKVMQNLYGGKSKKAWVLPSLDLEAITVKPERETLQVVYMGSTLDNLTNRAGAEKLVKEIIPAIEKKFPKAYHFHIIGKHSTRYFENQDNLTIHGFIEDLEAFMQNVDVVCIPVETGWGCKLKMLESLARGLPVIGAKQTFRGISPIENAYFACESLGDYLEAFDQLRQVNMRASIGKNAMIAYKQWRSQSLASLDLVFDELEAKTYK